MKIWIKNGTLVNEGRTFQADLLLNGEWIEEIVEGGIHEAPEHTYILDAKGQYVIPGVIDDQVHFREPGLTHKGDIHEGSRAAAAGGVTSFMDMPNVIPPTTTNALLQEKQEIAARHSLVNYSFYLGATNNNLADLKKLDPKTTCGVKVFMGASTGNMLVDNLKTLERLFAEVPILMATHCEDSQIINRNLTYYKQVYGEDIPATFHPLIRSAEACYRSSALAAQLAHKHNTRLHILHLSTPKEIELLSIGERTQKQITGEVCVHHLWFNNDAYRTKGHLVKWNPAIKSEYYRKALLQAVNENRIDVIATDHAPHLLTEKTGIYTKSASGGPMVQHSLVVMLQLVEQGVITFEQVIDKMCHAPADIFQIEKRGYLRKGYKADIALVAKHPWVVEKSNILYKCGWSPLEGTPLSYQVMTTLVNGKIVYQNGQFNESVRGELLTFQR